MHRRIISQRSFCKLLRGRCGYIVYAETWPDRLWPLMQKRLLTASESRTH